MSSKENREYREMQIRVETRAEEEQTDEPKEERFIVTGYATTFDEPYLLWKEGDDYEVWEKIDRAAFDDCDMDDVIMQYDHRGRVFARLRNNTLEVRPDEKGLFIRADLGGTDLGRGLYQEIAGGYTDRMSFGFSVDEDTREIVEDRTTGKMVVTRTITRVGKLYDVSAVSLPANPGTSISARLLDGVTEEVRAERLKAQQLAEERRRTEVRAKALGGIKE